MTASLLAFSALGIRSGGYVQWLSLPTHDVNYMTWNFAILLPYYLHSILSKVLSLLLGGNVLYTLLYLSWETRLKLSVVSSRVSKFDLTTIGLRLISFFVPCPKNDTSTRKNTATNALREPTWALMLSLVEETWVSSTTYRCPRIAVGLKPPYNTWSCRRPQLLHCLRRIFPWTGHTTSSLKAQS